jgi:hypothetical protein
MPLAFAAVLALPALPASADAVDSAVAAARGSGLPIRAEAEALANQSAASQAAAGELRHVSLGSLGSVCSSAGEIVGAGPSVGVVFDLFLKSPNHRPLLLSTAWTAMGTGLVTGSDGRLYISVVFCTETNPGAGSPPPPPAPANQPNTTAAPASTSPRLVPVVAPAPPVISVHDVFFRLVTGELHDLWSGVVSGTQSEPAYAPSPFLAMVDWSVTVAPSLS